MIRIGLDPGVKTGFAVTHNGVLQTVCTYGIAQALNEVKMLALRNPELIVVFEDARKRKWFGKRDENQRKYGAGVREGAGSIKRECAIWEEFLTLHGIPFDARKPAAGMSKWSAERFAKVTGWDARTSQHARDAALLIWGMR